MPEWREQLVEAHGVRLNVATMGSGPALLLLHGWPEFHLSWRHQIPVLAAAGFQVIAPDQRGFNRSDAPESLEAYTIDQLVADGAAVLTSLGIQDAVWIGHDWGGMVAWHAALLQPERVRAVVSLNTPYKGRGLLKPTLEYRRAPDGRFDYILEMQGPDEPERRLMADLPGRITTMIRHAAADASFWTDELRDAYVAAFERSGMHSVNLYRNLDENWLRMKPLAGRKIEQPALMITAEKDPILLPSMATGMQLYVPNVRIQEVPDCGHWSQQERPGEINRLILDFLRSLPAPAA